MGTTVIVLHPGIAENRPSDGGSVTKVDGTNFAYRQQEFTNGVDRQAFLQGLVVPPQLLTGPGDNVVFEFILRNITAAVSGNVRLSMGYRAINAPADRDGAALTGVAANTVVMPAFGQEVSTTFSVLASTFSSGNELLLYVKREGTDVLDTFGGDISIVRIEIAFPTLEPEWADGGTFIYPADGASEDVCIGRTTAPDVGEKLTVEGGHIGIHGASSGLWNGPHFVLGSYHLWFDGSGRLRVKAGVPASATDGQIIGAQS